MTIQAATPYLILSGRAQRALDLYQRVFGAKLEGVQRLLTVRIRETGRDLTPPTPWGDSLRTQHTAMALLVLLPAPAGARIISTDLRALAHHWLS